MLPSDDSPNFVSRKNKQGNKEMRLDLLKARVFMTQRLFYVVSNIFIKAALLLKKKSNTYTNTSKVR